LANGFVFVNLSADEPVPFEEHFGQLEAEWNGFESDEYEFSFAHSREEDYNWKSELLLLRLNSLNLLSALMDGFAEYTLLFCFGIGSPSL
jgi:hypothetical protein